MFTQEDLQQIKQHGLTEAQVEQQIENFRQGFPFLPVVRAAGVGDGVLRLDEEALARAEARYEEAAATLRVVKFVPASGAATRMFLESIRQAPDQEDDGACVGAPGRRVCPSHTPVFVFPSHHLGHRDSLQALWVGELTGWGWSQTLR